MTELLFAVKMAVISFVIVVLMQIRIGDDTIEQHAYGWIQTAAPVLFLREIAEGGLMAAHDGWARLTSNIKSKYWEKFDSDKLPGRRHLDVGLERSKVYLDEQNAKKEKIEAELASRARKVREAIGLDAITEDPVAEKVEE